MFLCFACGNRFLTEEEINKHICSFQPPLEPPRTELENDNDACVCTTCGKRFSRPFCRYRHQRESKCKLQMETKRTHCNFCLKSFTTYRYRLKHERICKIANDKTVQQEFVCKFCNVRFSTISQLKKHQSITKHSSADDRKSEVPNKQPAVKRPKENEDGNIQKKRKTNRQFICCRLCNNFQCSNFADLYDHRARFHSQTSEIITTLQSSPFDSQNPPWQNENGTIDQDFHKTYTQHKHLILKQKKTNLTTVSRYNFPTSDEITTNQLREHIEEIYEDNSNSFKINLSFGIILRHIRNGQYRYFAPYSNENVFDIPMLISNRSDVNKYMSRLTELDILNYIMRQRTETAWKPVLICNIVYTVHKTSFPLGNSNKLPNYIKRHKSIISLYTNPLSGKAYEDFLCMFRCLAYHKKKTVLGLERLTRQYHAQWNHYVKEQKLKTSDVDLSNICDVESCFQVNVNVFSLEENKSVTVIYKSRMTFDVKSTLNLNLFENHLSYITRFKTYSSKFKCTRCQMMFPTSFRLNRHNKSCQNGTRLKFPGGFYKPKKTIFDRLEEFNIFVKPELRHYPWFSVFDLESVLVPEKPSSNSNRTLVTSHKPVCVCLSSNIPGFKKEKLIFNECTDTLLACMCQYLTTLSNECKKLAEARWHDVVKALNDLDDKWNKENTLENKHVSVSSNASIDGTDFFNCMDAEETDEDEAPSADFLEKMNKENVWYRATKALHTHGELNIQYNDWDMRNDDQSECSSQSSGNMPYAEVTISNNKTEVDIDYNAYENTNDFIIQPFKALNATYSSNTSNDESDRKNCDDDYDGDNIYNDDETVSMHKEPPVYSNSNAVVKNKITNPCHHENGENATQVPAQLMRKKVLKMKSDFEAYCQQMPVIGFNSGKYDINLIKCELAVHLGLHNSKGRKFVLKKGNNYICLANEKVKFLDLSNYLPAGTSYDSFLVTFNVPIRKSYFPYEYLTNVDKLSETCLPPKECFFSSLKNYNTLEDKLRVKYCTIIEKENKTEDEALKLLNISNIPSSTIDKNYSRLQEIWVGKNMQTMKDFLQYYAELDVGPMVQGIETFQKFFIDKNLDLFKDFVSVPGIARKMLYDCGIKHGGSFSLFHKYDADLHETFMNSLTGGPSIIFTRHHKVNETFIRSNKKYPCKSIYGYDANSLYLKSICSEMPVGRYIRRKREDNFKPENKVKRYYSMYDWMDWISYKEGKFIKHKRNSGREFNVGPFYVDGKSNKNEIFEFLGCRFHSCPKCTDSNEKNSKNFKKTIARLNFIREQGFKVVYIWECEYRRQLKEYPEMKQFVNKNAPSFYRKYPKKVTEKQILDGIMNNELFGFVEVDIKIPDSWDQVKFKPKTNLSPYQYFHEFCPLFVTTLVPFEKIGNHMQEHVKQFNLSQKPRKLLVGGLYAEKILLMTPLVKWYISQGLLVTKVYQVIEYSKMACFKEFGEQVTEARREGDRQQNKQIIALLFKLIANAAFGGTLLNKEKHKLYKYIHGFRKACLAVNNPRFDNLIEFGNEIYEVEFRKANIVLDNPIILGIAILNMAKLHLLKFYYEFLNEFIDRDQFECLECDTDSLYFALAKESISEAVKPEKKEEYMHLLIDYCDDTYNAEAGVNNVWFPRECCQDHNKYDQRTPGLMKKEFEATCMTGLSSKSYVAKQEKTGAVKYSLKGVNKDFIDPTNKFEKVLSNQETINATNRGIAVFNNSLYSYQQTKSAFTYFYCKRRVCDDGIHTEPLDMCLKPVKRNLKDS